MILSDSKIFYYIETGDIKISPFDLNSLGSNSYDVHLSDTLLTYDRDEFNRKELDYIDAKRNNPTTVLTIPEEGLVLYPNQLYLGSTVEYTESHLHVPFLDGKSSIGRLGINIHATAGVGDVGFCNHWTLEIYCIIPVKIYPNMPIGQLYFHSVEGKVRKPYNKKQTAKYKDVTPLPVPSKMFENKF